MCMKTPTINGIDLTDTTHIRRASNSSEFLEDALAACKNCGHLHGVSETARKHLEFAAAHLRQAWIAEDGQNATTPEQTHKDVAAFYRLQDLILAREAK